MERKLITAEIVKAEDGSDESTGKVIARFGHSGVRDLHGDMIVAGAIGVQDVQVSQFGHMSWMGSLPVGKGATREDGAELFADLDFFMQTTHGRDHFETMKALGDLGEWSFGFDILEHRDATEEERAIGIDRVLVKLEVFEVSPVLRGAGIDTATVEAKCEGCQIEAKKAEEAQVAAAHDAARGGAPEVKLEAAELEAKELKDAIADVCNKAALTMAAIDYK